MKFLINLLCLFSCSWVLAQKNDLFIEKPIANTQNKNPYNYDNTLFTPRRNYIYDYVIILNKDSFRYKIINDAEGLNKWVYVPYDDYDSATIYFLGIKTLNEPGPIMAEHPEYAQTEIILDAYNLHSKSLNRELTGVVENEKNIWLHPFRMDALQILQLAPFPFVKLSPDENNYNWSLRLGRHWKEFTRYNWKGKLNMNCLYQKQRPEILETEFGNIPTIVTNATAKMKIGKSYLTSYFNKNLGFVKLVYDNVDKSKIILTLREVKTDL